MKNVELVLEPGISYTVVPDTGMSMPTIHLYTWFLGRNKNFELRVDVTGKNGKLFTRISQQYWYLTQVCLVPGMVQGIKVLI